MEGVCNDGVEVASLPTSFPTYSHYETGQNEASGGVGGEKETKESVFTYARAKTSYLSQANPSLVPRLHPLMKKKKSNLVNQVKF